MTSLKHIWRQIFTHSGLYCTLCNNEDASLTRHLLCWSERSKLPWKTSNVTEIDLESVGPLTQQGVTVAVNASLLRDMAMSNSSLQFPAALKIRRTTGKRLDIGAWDLLVIWDFIIHWFVDDFLFCAFYKKFPMLLYIFFLIHRFCNFSYFHGRLHIFVKFKYYLKCHFLNIFFIFNISSFFVYFTIILYIIRLWYFYMIILYFCYTVVKDCIIINIYMKNFKLKTYFFICSAKIS